VKTLIYIISSPRSGSTLLANILGNSQAFFNAGEISSINGFINENSRQADAFNNRCSCGDKFNNCIFWEGILHSAASQLGISIKKISTWIKIKNKIPLRFLFKKKHLASIQREVLAGNSGKYAARHAFAIFDNIVAETGCSVVIDSSKKLTNLIAYNEYAPADWKIKVVYIYRDPEATALSVQKAGNRLDIDADKNYYLNLLKCVHYNSLIKMCLKKCEHFSISLNELCLDFEKFEYDLINFLNLSSTKRLSLVSSKRIRHDIGGSVSISELEERIKLKLDESWANELSLVRKFISKIIKTHNI